jgi:RNA polymerase sigma factor (TIGR02999 family)
MSEVTRILNSIDHGDPKAAEELLPLVYEELRKLARAQMVNEKPGQTLQATALVHEAYLHLIGSHETDWHGRNHFFMAAAESMRRILIWNARKKQRLKRGGHLKRTVLEEIQIATETDPDTLLEVESALELLREVDATKAELVKLRFFIGLTNLEAAKVLQISEKTATRYWVWARAWLFDAISKT